MQIRHTEHTITVPAPPDTVYDIIVDAGRWPALFTPTVHIEYLSSGQDDEQLLRVWALAGDSVASWISHRTLDRAVRRVGFRQTSPASPLANMRGEWVVFGSTGASRVVFRHWFTAENDDPAVLDKIEAVVNRNSQAELASLRAAAARAHLVVDFEDEVETGAGQESIYRFLARADEWPRLLPHVARVSLTEDPAGVQLLDMDTVEGGGEDVHNTVSVRVLLPPGTIVYKQTTLPPFLHAHVGSWHVRQDGTSVARHTVVLREEAIPAILGPDATVQQAAGVVRRALGGNSKATLRRASELAATGR